MGAAGIACLSGMSMSGGEGFVSTPRTFELFFWLCKRYKIDDKAGRVALLRKLVQHHRAKYVRDPKAYIKGKRVGRIKE